VFAVLHISEFPLHAVLRATPGLVSAQPVAILAHDTTASARSRAIVLAANLPARTLGITAGLTASQALARCAALRLLSASLAAETEAHATLLATAFTLSPLVEATAPGTATADVTGLAADERLQRARRSAPSVVEVLVHQHRPCDEHLGFDQARVIDATRHRLPGSAGSYTFHGRDLFAYVGAQLATGKLRLDDVGPRLTNAPTRITYQHAALTNGTLAGVIPVLDIQYGNVWSNIGRELFEQLGAKPGDRFEVRLLEKGRVRAKFEAPYATTFGAVPEGKPLLFLNSLHDVAVALNQASLAQRYKIGSGPDWTMQVRPLRKASSPR
jgi:hypothetical protein